MAINLSRSPRVVPFLEGVSSSGPGLGPGAYDRNVVRPFVEPSSVPFQSLQGKHAPNRSTSAMTPGPGAYVVRESEVAPGATHSFKSTSARLAPQTPGSSQFLHSTLLHNPGPGTYSYTKPWVLRKIGTPQKGQPILELCKTVASIPSVRATMSGADDGQSKEGHTGEKDDTVGPKYDVTGNMTGGRATNFVSSELGRNLWEPSCAIENTLPSRSNPGPGTYQRGSSAPTHGSKCVFMSKTPMCHQRPEENKPDFPLEGVSGTQIGEGPAAEHAFQSQVQRTGWSRPINQPFKDPYSRAVPGPGHYYKHNADPNPEPVLKKSFHGVHHPSQIVALNELTGPVHAFNSTDIRPCNRQTVHDTPAPGQYNGDVPGTTILSTVQEKALVGKKGIFGTTADRFFRGQFDASTLVSGGVDSRDYDPEIKTDTNDPCKRPLLQSGTTRFAGDPATGGELTKHETPGPTHYCPAIEVNYRSPFRNPRTEHVSFGSGKPRFSPNEVFQGVQHNTCPGPGQYHESGSRKITGVARTRARRKLSGCLGSTSEAVGPGTYELSGTMFKKSFNVS